MRLHGWPLVSLFVFAGFLQAQVPLSDGPAPTRRELWELRIGTGGMFLHELLVPVGCEDVIPFLQSYFLEPGALSSSAATYQLDGVLLLDNAKLEAFIANINKVRTHLQMMIEDDVGKGTIPLALKKQAFAATGILLSAVDTMGRTEDRELVAQASASPSTPSPQKKGSKSHKSEVKAPTVARAAPPVPKNGFFKSVFGSRSNQAQADTSQPVFPPRGR